MILEKYPIPEFEKERIEALYRYKILDTLSEQEFDEITKLVTFICDVPIALITLIDSERQWFKSKIGIDGTETLRKDSFCQHAIMQNQVYEVSDTLKSPVLKDNPFVTGDMKLRYYAGAPINDAGWFQYWDAMCGR